jgi:DNA-binding Lrp family transcriptional regulator
MENLDEIDRQILDSAKKFEGQPIARVIKPLARENFSAFGLRDRVYKLEKLGLLQLKKVENGRILVFVKTTAKK